MSASDRPKEPFLQRNAWILFAVVAFIFISFGIGDVVLGGDADPAIAESIIGVEWEALQSSSPDVARFVNASSRILGITLLCASILTLAIILSAFRSGRPWSWFALWVWPMWFVVVFAITYTAKRSPNFPPPPPMMTAPIFFVLSTLALLFSYRKFFPKAPLGEDG